MKKYAIVGVLWLVSVVAVAWFARTSKAPEVRYQRVEVPAEAIEDQEPDTVVRWRDRIVHVTPEADQIATAEGGAEDDVSRFCEERVQTVTRADTIRDTIRPPPIFLARSLTHDPSWAPFGFGMDRITVTGPLSTGDLRAIHHRVRPGFSVRTHADTTIVRYNRSSRLKAVARDLGLVGLGALIRHVLGWLGL